MRMKLTAIFDNIIKYLYVLAGILAICVMFTVCTDVVMRYFLHRPLEWSVRFTEISLLYVTFLGTAWVLKKEGHVKVDAVLTQLSPRAQTLLNLVTSIIGVMICLLITWYGAKVTVDHFLRGSFFVGIPEWPSAPVIAIVPIGSFLLFIQFLRRSAGFMASWKQMKPKN